MEEWNAITGCCKRIHAKREILNELKYKLNENVIVDHLFFAR